LDTLRLPRDNKVPLGMSSIHPEFLLSPSRAYQLVFSKVIKQTQLLRHYTGQTTETLGLPSDPLPFERIVGVPLKSYVSLSWTSYFKK
jgi:hypothetical protein